MKKIVILLISILMAVPILADDLQPAPTDQAIQQYQSFWKTEDPDPMNHEVWKLYIFAEVPPSDQPDATEEFAIAGLTPSAGTNYFVRLKINQLYSFLWPVPKKGSVIVVGGRVTDHRDYHTVLPGQTVVLKTLTMNLDGASLVSGEHFDSPVTADATTPKSPFH